MTKTKPNYMALADFQELWTTQIKPAIPGIAAADISKKVDKLTMTGSGAATENDFMAIDANGNAKDSGKKASDFAAASHNHDSLYYGKSQTYSKTEVDSAIAACERRYMVTVASHKLVFAAGSAVVSSHKVILV